MEMPVTVTALPVGATPIGSPRWVARCDAEHTADGGGACRRIGRGVPGPIRRAGRYPPPRVACDGRGAMTSHDQPAEVQVEQTATEWMQAAGRRDRPELERFLAEEL